MHFVVYICSEVLTCMQGENAERWRELCEQVIVEQNSDRLMKLVQELTRLLEQKETRLRNHVQSGGRSAG